MYATWMQMVNDAMLALEDELNEIRLREPKMAEQQVTELRQDVAALEQTLREELVAVQVRCERISWSVGGDTGRATSDMPHAPR